MDIEEKTTLLFTYCENIINSDNWEGKEWTQFCGKFQPYGPALDSYEKERLYIYSIAS